MKVKSLHLNNFKRFTDLTITDIPETAKLVLLIGPNGCGKSSIFDAFLSWYREKYIHPTHGSYEMNPKYYIKDQSAVHERINTKDTIQLEVHDQSSLDDNCFYYRGATRNEPEIGEGVEEIELWRKYHQLRTIDGDYVLSGNYARLLNHSLAALYDGKNSEKIVREVRDALVGAINQSLSKVFGDLAIDNLITNYKKILTFKKQSTAYEYLNLSAGEKAGFDLILDIHLKANLLPNALFCIDEIEGHLHTASQGKILKELFSLINDQSQLWVSTHSLGVLRAAQELAYQCPSQVCILDFSDLDVLDAPDSVLTPSSLNKSSWGKMLELTLGDLTERISPKYFVICEGSTIGKRRKDFDADIYNFIFHQKYPDILFISGGGCGELENTREVKKETLKAVSPGCIVNTLSDRDDKTDDEVREAEKHNSLTLSLRNIESYILSNEVISQFMTCQDRDAGEAKKAIELRDEAVAECVQNQRKPDDDLKSAAGLFYNKIREQLQIRRCGGNKDAFLKEMAKFITPDTKIYEQLERDIIKKIIP